MLDLDKLEKKLDDTLEAETAESLKKWLREQSKVNRMSDTTNIEDIKWYNNLFATLTSLDGAYAEKPAKRILTNFAQAHTAQRLSELKEEIIDVEPELRNTTLIRKEDILQLIEDSL